VSRNPDSQIYLKLVYLFLILQFLRDDSYLLCMEKEKDGETLTGRFSGSCSEAYYGDYCSLPEVPIQKGAGTEILTGSHSTR
jgi:hypothetical protein